MTFLKTDLGLTRALVISAVACTVLLYAVGSWNAQPVLDDASGILGHRNHGDLLGEWLKPTYAHAMDGKGGMMWSPLSTTVQHVLALVMGRDSIVPFRLLNLVTHACSVLLAAKMAWRLGAGVATGVAAWVIATHPVLAPSVAWASDYNDVLAAMVLLAGANAILAHSATAAPVLAAFAAFAACLCKPSMSGAAVALVLVVWHAHGRRAAVIAAIASVVAVGAHAFCYNAVVGGKAASLDALTSLPGATIALTGMLAWWIAPPPWSSSSHLFDLHDYTWPVIGVTVTGVCVAAALAMPTASRRLAWLAMASWVGALLPSAVVSVPVIGLQPFRYAYVPFVLAAPIAAAAGAKLLNRRLGLLLAFLWIATGLPLTIDRLSAWHQPLGHAMDEYAREPGNAYVEVRLGKELYLAAPHDAAQALALWERGLDNLPPRLRVTDFHADRMELAKASFVAGDYRRALRAAEVYVARDPRPSLAWCLIADASDRLHDPDRAALADVRCRP